MNADTFNRYLSELKTSEAAFRKIYEYYLPKLKVHILSRFGRQVDFEDVAHDLFTKLIRADALPWVENPTAWMYKICDNLALDHLRRKDNGVPLDERIASGLEGESRLNAEGDTGFFDLLDRLDGDEREIVKLIIWEGYNLKEGAKLLKISHGAARQKYSRALKKLKGLL